MTARGFAWPVLSELRWCYALIFTLYAYQGLVAGFALIALPNHYTALGATTVQIGAHIATVGLPWILQPLWGPVVDRFAGFRMGRRRFWVVLALVASLVALARLLLLDDVPVAGLAAISAVFLVHSACAALIDTATDGMIIDQVPTARLGTASAITRSGFVCGSTVGAALFAWVLPSAGLTAATWTLLAIGGGVLLLPLLVRERAADAWLSLRRSPAAERDVGSLGALLRRLVGSLSRWPDLLLLAFCFAIDFAGAAFRVPLGIALIQDRGWDPAALSSFQAAIALLTGTAGALLIGWWTDRVGPGRALSVLLGLCAISHVAAGLLLRAPDPAGAAIAGPVALGLSTVIPALVFVALAPAVMRASRGPAAATRFALFMAALNMGDVSGSALAGAIVGGLGLSATGLLSAAVFAAAAVIAGTRLPGVREGR